MVYIHNDHLGTPQLMTDAEGVVVWRANRLPFGEAVAAVTGIDLSLQFPGQYADDETGYYQNYFRDYDPSLGRYIQSDPIGLLGGVNTFGYVLGNPTIYVDMWGVDTSYWTGGEVPPSQFGVGLGHSVRATYRSLNYHAANNGLLGGAEQVRASSIAQVYNRLEYAFVTDAEFRGNVLSAYKGYLSDNMSYALGRGAGSMAIGLAGPAKGKGLLVIAGQKLGWDSIVGAAGLTGDIQHEIGARLDQLSNMSQSELQDWFEQNGAQSCFN